MLQGQFVDSYDPTIENTYNKTVKINNQAEKPYKNIFLEL